MLQSAVPSSATKTSSWLNPRRPVLFIVQGTLFYTCTVTFGQILWSYYGHHDATAMALREILERAFANFIAGLFITLFLWYRTRSKIP